MTDERLPKLPRGWFWTTLDFCSQEIYRYPTFYGMKHLERGIPVIRGEHIGDDGRISHDWSNYWFVSGEISKKFPKTIVASGDLIMSVRGSVGKIGLADDKLENAQVSPNCLRISLLKDYCLPQLIFFYLKSAYGQAVVQKMTNATTIQTIKAGIFSKMAIPLPPLPEQPRIVAKIEELFTRLDAGVEALKRVKAQLKRYRQAVLKYAFEGKLTQEWREANKDKLEHAPVLLERIEEERKKKAGGKFKELPPVSASDLPELPGSWAWIPLPALGGLNRGKSKHRPRDDKRLFGGNYPFIQTGDVRNSKGLIKAYAQTYNDLGLKQSRLWPVNTLCITIAANIAETSILGIEACFPDSIVGFIADETICNVKYVYFFFKTMKEKLESLLLGPNRQNCNSLVLLELF